ncbi:MAG: ATP-grasp domain-containing protein [Gammaproteobacteria bacterium]
MSRPSPKIALFANKDSAQLLVLRDILEEEGATPLVFDIQLGGPSAPSVVFGSERVLWNQVDFADIDVIHIRCACLNTPTTLPAVLNAAVYSELRSQYLREQEYQSVTYSFFERLIALGKLVINPLTGAYVDHDSKAQLYEKLRGQGFAVPRSLMTNDPQRALAFINEVSQAVVKPSIGIGSTRKVTETDLQRLEELEACPVLIQEFLVGNTLRVHIVGDRVVLALRILSEGQVDSRTDPTGFEYHQLPEGQERLIVKANRALGLHYAAWDIIAAEDGRYVYLDCNPGPYILWIGPEYTHAVLRQLAVYMLTYGRTHSLEEASSQVQPWKLAC